MNHHEKNRICNPCRAVCCLHAGLCAEYGRLGRICRLSVGYIVPSGKAGVYLDWGSGSGNISEAAHTVLVSGGLPCYTGERFSVVPKVGLGMGTAENGNGDRKYYFAAALSATLRYYVSNSFYCGFDARFVGLNSSLGKPDGFMYNPEFGICVGLVL